jgi:hypothetical protein
VLLPTNIIASFILKVKPYDPPADV